jgi:hypothetical protein
MAESLFTELQAAAFREGLNPRTKKAREWFRKKAQGLGDVNKLDLISDNRLTQLNAPAPGQMFMYFYDPKTKKKLPYYDTFPLILMVESAPKGFYGLNLHYLPPPLRAKLFDALLETANNKKYDDSTKLKINYSILKSTEKFSAFQPCFKRYLSGYVKSKIVRVDAPEWPIAMFLPTESFRKAGTGKVWSDSRKMI